MNQNRFRFGCTLEIWLNMNERPNREFNIADTPYYSATLVFLFLSALCLNLSSISVGITTGLGRKVDDTSTHRCYFFLLFTIVRRTRTSSARDIDTAE